MRFGRHAIGFAGLALILLGCQPTLVRTPAQFVRVDERSGGPYDYRATSADGVVLAARVIPQDAESGGDLRFWCDAIIRRLRLQRGYALDSEQDVKTKSGQAGKQLRFGHDQGGKPYRYWVAVFVVEDRIYLLEMGGQAARFDARVDAFNEVVADLRI